MCKISIRREDYRDNRSFLRTLILNQPEEFNETLILKLANKGKIVVSMNDVLSEIYEAVDDGYIVRLNGKYYPVRMMAYSPT